jgi:TIGR03009 family protein
MGKLLYRSMPLLVLVGILSIATPDARSAAPPRPGLRLEVVLREWAKANDVIHSVRYRFTRTERDLAFDTRTVTKGEVQRLKPDLLRVDVGNAGDRTIWLSTKEKIHFFNPAGKTETIYSKPADRSFPGEKTPERSFLDILTRWLQQQVYWHFAGLVELPVRNLSRRFDLRLSKEDTWYIYLDIQPRRPQDKPGFERMRVVLLKDSFRVRQIWYEYANGNATTLDFEKPDTKAKVTPESIRKGLPEGWKRIDLAETLKAPRKD